MIQTATDSTKQMIRDFEDLNSVTIDFHAEIVTDFDPDLSWLDQTDAEMGEGFEESARKRLDAYNNGEWHMVGIVVTGTVENSDGEIIDTQSSSLWGIESDSSDEYFREEKQNLRDEVARMICVFGYA